MAKSRAAFSDVSAAAIASIDRVLARWLPEGKRQGNEYVTLNPARADTRPGSFKVNVRTGAWADFAVDDRGGDLISLIAYLDGISQSVARDKLAEFLGLKTEPPRRIEKRRTQQPQESWTPIQPVPENAPVPPDIHPRHGAPTARWTYRDRAGRVLCYVDRFDVPKSGERTKQFAPLTFSESTRGARQWRHVGLPAPRPLYNLDRLDSNPNSSVIVVEGEKAADAAALLLTDHVPVTMLNGAQAPHKTDWKPLKDRTVILWPDNDEPGIKCMQAVTELVKAAGARSVVTIDLKVLRAAGPLDTLPPKFDAADALEQVWIAETMKALLARPDIFISTGAAPTQKPSSNFFVDEMGLWFVDGKGDEPGRPRWLCSPLIIEARARNDRNEDWSALLRFSDFDGNSQSFLLPLASLSPRSGIDWRGELLSRGLRARQSPGTWELIARYLCDENVPARLLITEKPGWNGDSFITTNGRAIGGDRERIVYSAKGAASNACREQGTLEEWRNHVAALCVGNSRLILAVSAALTAPLLLLSGLESGGVNFRGASSTGKTTLLYAAVSAWGAPNFMQRWRATDNGLESLAVQHNDMLLPLDELALMDPRMIGEAAYMLSNGAGKSRANQRGGARAVSTWRLIFLSTGEIGLSAHMLTVGKRAHAGQEIRLLDVPSEPETAHGAFEQLHGRADGAALAKEITEAAAKCFGTAAPAFIEKIIEHRQALPDALAKARRAFAAESLPSDAGGQVDRAATRFALFAAAGELATAFEITGWQQGDATAAAAKCFRDWIRARGGAGNLEELQMIEDARLFLQQFGEARFSPIEHSHAEESRAPRTQNRAGFSIKNNLGGVEWLVYAEVFKRDVCRGHDWRVMSQVLIKHGYLKPDAGGRSTRPMQLPGHAKKERVFHLRLSGGDEQDDNPTQSNVTQLLNQRASS